MEEAFRLVMSAGFLAPDQLKAPAAQTAVAGEPDDTSSTPG